MINRFPVVVITLTGMLLCQSTPFVYAVPPQVSISEREAQLKTLFSTSHDFLTKTEELCSKPGRERCKEIVTQAMNHLSIGQRNHTNEGLTGEDQTEWLNAHAAYYLQLQVELYNLAEREAPVSLNTNPPLRGYCLNRVNYTCGDVLAVSLGICALYAAAPGVGLAVAAACGAAAIYGYIRCMNTEKGTVGTS